MKYFDIKGMSCAACSARVEQAVSRLEGVKACSVSLLTNSMAVDSNLPDEQIIAAVTNAGYSASLKGGATLFLTIFALVLEPINSFPAPLSCSTRLTSIRIVE